MPKSIAKRSAASRKSWRTRKKMKAARLEQHLEDLREQYDKDAEAGLVWPRKKYARALPCPDYGEKR